MVTGEEWIDAVKFFIEGLCIAVLGLFGIFGNLISIKVLSSTELGMTPTFRHLMKMLAAFDATFLIFTLSLFCASSWSVHFDEYVRPVLTPYALPIIQISLTGSVWTTTAVSVERFVSVCLSCRNHSPQVMHLCYTLPIVVFSFLFNVTRFFELRTEWKASNETVYDESGDPTNETLLKPMLEPTALRMDPSYSRDYVLLANTILLVFIPMILLLVLNSLIFLTINKATRRHNAISSNQRRDHKVAMMLISIVVVFVICHSVRSVVNTYECIQMLQHGELKNWPVWIQFLVHTNHFALVVNSSINILIYACKDEKFLRVLLITCRVKTQHQLTVQNGNHHNRQTNPRGGHTNKPHNEQNGVNGNHHNHRRKGNDNENGVEMTLLDPDNGNGVVIRANGDTTDEKKGKDLLLIRKFGRQLFLHLLPFNLWTKFRMSSNSWGLGRVTRFSANSTRSGHSIWSLSRRELQTAELYE